MAVTEKPIFHRANLYVKDGADWVPMTQPAGGGGPSTPVSLANGGTGQGLVDPNADRIIFWDDSAGHSDWLRPNTNLAISGTDLNVSSTPTFTFPVLSATAFAALPGAPAAGTLAYVSDSNTVTWGATIAGGGANKVLAWFNGTVWTVAGK